MKRLLDTTSETLDKMNDTNADQFVAELTQLKLSIVGKQEVLIELDDVILDKIKEDEIDGEIEQADNYNERIIKALIDTEARSSYQAPASSTTTSPTTSTNLNSGNQEKHCSNLGATHSLKCATQTVNLNETLEQDLKKFLGT